MAHLCAMDQVVASLAERHGPPAMRRMSLGKTGLEIGSIEGIYFADLVDIVIHQQLAGKAAAAIAQRFSHALGGRVSPQVVLSTDPEILRAQGLSRAKLLAITELAREVNEGKFDLGELGLRSDDEVIARVSKLRGFGVWSAQMFLMFSLQRLDVWPANDLGVRKGYRYSYSLEMVPSSAELMAHGERFRPYRSLVAWYMWRSLEEPSLTSTEGVL